MAWIKYAEGVQIDRCHSTLINTRLWWTISSEEGPEHYVLIKLRRYRKVFMFKVIAVYIRTFSNPKCIISNCQDSSQQPIGFWRTVESEKRFTGALRSPFRATSATCHSRVASVPKQKRDSIRILKKVIFDGVLYMHMSDPRETSWYVKVVSLKCTRVRKEKCPTTQIMVRLKPIWDS